MISTSKRNYYKEKFKKCKGNSSETWKTIQKIMPTKQNNKQISNNEQNKEKADEFNNFFANVGKEAFDRTQYNSGIRDYNPVRNPRLLNNIPRFRPKTVDMETVIPTVKHLRNTSATGCDNISLEFIKDALP